MDLVKSIMIAASALKAQSGRMRVISENLANAQSTATTATGDPYRRKMVTFDNVYNRELGAYEVRAGDIKFDRTDFGQKYEPGHPAANTAGYVKTPNVNPLVEMMDMRQAQLSYEANLNVVRSARTMAARTLDILRA
ncbi:MAG: flagellar basal body rod protein FlgC [Hyphomicrobiales bacterium]